MFAILFALSIGHAKLNSKAPLTLDAFYGTYHGVSHSVQALDNKVGEVFTLTFDKDGLTIPVEIRPHGATEPARVWKVHYAMENLVTDGPIVQSRTKKNQMCVGLRASRWSNDITDVVCFKFGPRLSLEFTPFEGSAHAGRALALRDRMGRAVQPDITAPATRGTLAANGILRTDRLTDARAANLLRLIGIRLENMTDEEKAQTINGIGRGYRASSAGEMMAINQILVRALQPDQADVLQFGALKQVALYVQSSSMVPRVLELLRTSPEHHPSLLELAIDAAEALLEPLSSFVEATDHLHRYFDTTDVKKIHARVNGEIEAADFASIMRLDTTRAWTTWSFKHKVDLIDALTNIAENPAIVMRLRRRAVEIALTFTEPKNDIQNYLVYKSKSPISTEGMRQRSGEVARMFDGDRAAAMREVALLSELDLFERYYHHKLSELYWDHVAQPYSAHRVRCAALLTKMDETESHE